MSTHRQLVSRCPWCHSRHDTAKNVSSDNVAPADGDFFLCFDCGEWSVWEDNAQRKPTDQEFEELVLDPDVGKAREAWLATAAGPRFTEPSK